ncbi:hypothetical protein PVAND_009309 [Polypedilum vanderplanki]|uniref:Uncharacterized protein n=1 Tax=Polypedilum vanderplanki TaxID=319348 RepID=A0A9J6CC80_POLVA|nr:hypothetical protein PVAND_009309 [Polypedilum vanderplanki]
MCILAANVHEKTKKPIEVLRKIPNKCWNNNTKRFQRELYNDICALTGMNFLPITRRIVLSIATKLVPLVRILVMKCYETQMEALIKAWVFS